MSDCFHRNSAFHFASFQGPLLPPPKCHSRALLQPIVCPPAPPGRGGPELPLREDERADATRGRLRTAPGEVPSSAALLRWRMHGAHRHPRPAILLALAHRGTLRAEAPGRGVVKLEMAEEERDKEGELRKDAPSGWFHHQMSGTKRRTLKGSIWFMVLLHDLLHL